MKVSKKWLVNSLTGILLLSITFITALAENGSLNRRVTYLSGNFCTVSGGISLHDDPHTGTFSVDVPGTPVSAHWFWSAQSRGAPYSSDNRLEIRHNDSSSNRTIAATEEFSSFESDGTWQWHSYTYTDHTLWLVESGTNTYYVKDVDTTGVPYRNHGVGIVIVYESPECPTGKISVHVGLDSLSGDYDPSDGSQFGPNSEIFCQTFEPADVERSYDSEFFVGGVADQSSLNNIWYRTGSGELPTDLTIPAGGALKIENPLQASHGADWDIYQVESSIKPSDTYACFQIEAPASSDFNSVMRAVWIGFTSNLNTPDMPTATPSDTPTTIPSDTPTAIPSDTPTATPSDTPTTIPSDTPTTIPSDTPTATPSDTPTAIPSDTPTAIPSDTPTAIPSDTPTAIPSDTPTAIPSDTPTATPSDTPTAIPSDTPTAIPSDTPTAIPSDTPTAIPSDTPTAIPSDTPSAMPSDTQQPIPNPTSTSTQTTPATLLGSIGDRIWYDDNGDGLQNPGEEGIPGVVLSLINEKGAILSQVTDSDGVYTFTNLEQMIYTLVLNKETLPASLQQTTHPPNMVNEESHLKLIIKLGLAQHLDNYDFGYQRFSCIGDRVWIDANADTIQETGERGIMNAELLLINSADKIISTTVTTADGTYNFCDLSQGSYMIEVSRNSIPSDASQTFEKDGSLNGKTVVTVAGGQNLLDVDFGYQNPIDLELTATASPPYIRIGENVTFKLELTNNGIAPATSITIRESMSPELAVNYAHPLKGAYDRNSHVWTINKLAPGETAKLEIDASMNGAGPYKLEAQIFSVQQSDNDSSPGNGDPNEDDQDSVWVSQQPKIVGDKVWLDENSDGIQNPNEYGLANINVTLYDSEDNIVDTTVTDADGQYQLMILSPGEYSVGIDVPNGYAITFQNKGDNDQIDSDAVPRTARTDRISYESNTADNSIDIGLAEASVNLQLSNFDNGVTAYPTEQITYTVAYENIGIITATTVILQQIVPDHTSFVANSSDSRWACVTETSSGREICTLSIGSLESGAAGSVLFVVEVSSSLPLTGYVVSTVTLSSDTTTPGGANSGESLTPIRPSLLKYMPWHGTQE